jgi:hypothetical protein
MFSVIVDQQEEADPREDQKAEAQRRRFGRPMLAVGAGCSHQEGRGAAAFRRVLAAGCSGAMIPGTSRAPIIGLSFLLQAKY